MAQADAALDALLSKVWDATRAPGAAPAFEFEVLQRVAQRRLQREIGLAVALSLAVFAIAWAVSPSMLGLTGAIRAVLTSGPVMMAVLVGLSAWMILALSQRLSGVRGVLSQLLPAR